MRSKISNRAKFALLFSAAGIVGGVVRGAIVEFANGPWKMLESALLGAFVCGLLGLYVGYDLSRIFIALFRINNWCQNQVRNVVNPENTVRRTTCPICETPLPKYRIPSTARQTMFGGCNCDRCGCEVDRFGNELKG